MGKKARNYGSWGSGSGGVRQAGQVLRRNAGETPHGMRTAADRQQQVEHLRRLVAKLTQSQHSGERRHG